MSPRVLRRLGEHYERDDNMRGKIKSAMTYPVIVLVFGVAAVIGALVWRIPKFQTVFDSMGASLPLPTLIQIGMSHALIEYGWLMAIGLAVVVVWFRKWRATESGMRCIDAWKLKAPLIKGIVASGAYSSLALTRSPLSFSLPSAPVFPPCPATACVAGDAVPAVLSLLPPAVELWYNSRDMEDFACLKEQWRP